MTVNREKRVLEDYLAAKDLKSSRQREEILAIFLSLDRHLTANELYNIVRKKYPRLGFATIYRTLKLLCACELCREFKLEDGITRYEHLYGHRHHDHLVCTQCGRFVEVVEPDIERLQAKLFKRHGFYPQRHRLELYGICRNCEAPRGKPPGFLAKNGKR